MGEICYSLKGVSNAYCNFMVQTRMKAVVEIRLDDCMLDEDQLKQLFSSERSARTIATYHIEDSSQLEEASRLLSLAILSGSDYVDIPLDWPENRRQWLVSLALNKGCRIIISYHDYNGTGPLISLVEKARTAFSYGADIAKIVTTAHCEEDWKRVMGLYDLFPSEKLVAFAMGKEGYDSRLVSFSKGAPLFYLSPSRKRMTAPGQPVYFDFLEEDQIVLCGESDLPASKSFAQRAIVLSALAEGTTRLYGMTLCDDICAAIGVAESFGAEVSLEGTTLTVTGHQDILGKGLTVKDNTLFVGESALLARLCIPLAGLSDEDITIVGEKSLLGRRIDDHRSALKKLGLAIDYTDKCYLPAVVKGRLKGGVVSLNGKKGSQMISGLLLALSQCRSSSAIAVEQVTSSPYINLTTYIASFFGLCGYEVPTTDDDEIYYVSPNQKIEPVIGFEMEKDWSSAAMLMAAGAIMGDISLRGLDTCSNQADSVIFLMMEDCNIDIEEKNNVINVRKSMITPFYFDITDCPDLFAPLFLLASQAEGESIIAGVGRLKNKESNRARTFSSEFSKLGIKSRIVGDEIFIRGHENFVYDSAVCSSHGDHRLAMALYVASLVAKGPVEIEGMESIAKSFPNFVETIGRLKKK
ncbi:MAG: type I 3-dehydroquinate dehydratase [Bacteroidales bacterium]|nr:type I 3-dehydroquinate dehydratase [Candidatus Cacconaster merdequi]